jgi:hypothetical protein
MAPGTRFGYGDYLFLGDQWDVIEPNFSLHDAPNQGDQLFVYCFDETNLMESFPYKVLAALSTSGKSFVQPNQPFYWDNESALPPHLDENGYSVIILPKESTWSGAGGELLDNSAEGTDNNIEDVTSTTSGGRTTNGYRYSGPIFSRQDAYAKALINTQYWQPMDLFPTNLPPVSDNEDDFWSSNGGVLFPTDSDDEGDSSSDNGIDFNSATNHSAGSPPTKPSTRSTTTLVVLTMTAFILICT